MEEKKTNQEAGKPQFNPQFYQEPYVPSMAEVFEKFKLCFNPMPVGEFPRKKLKAYIAGAAVALCLSISLDIYSNHLDSNYGSNYATRVEQLREDAYATRAISGTMLGLLLATGGLEKLTGYVRDKRKKNLS